MVNIDTVRRQLPDNTNVGDLNINNGIISSTASFLEIKTTGNNGSNAVVLASNSGASETIEIHNTQGTLGHALHFVSNVGGMYVDTSKDITLDSGTSNLVVKGDSLILQKPSGSTNSNAKIEVTSGDAHVGLSLLPKGDGRVNILGSSSNTGGVRLYQNENDTGSYIELYAPSGLSSSTAYKLPSDDGSNGQFLKTSGTGTLSWDTVITSIKLNEIQNGDGNAVLNNPAGFTEIKVSGSGANRSNAIVLTSNSGVNETIEIHNTMGTSDGSGAGSGVGKYAINVVAHKGGINMEANSNIVLIPGATGNVGINTIHPDYTLDVAGDINLTGNIFVNGSQGVSNSLIPSLRTWIYEGDGNSGLVPYNIQYNVGDIISFDREHYDSFNAYDTSTYSYTIPSSGKYYIGVNLYINYSPSTYSKIAVLKNPDTANTVIMTTNTYGEAGQTMSGIFDLTADDVIKVKNIGRESIYLGTGSGYTEMSIHQVNYGHTFTNYYQTTFENISLDIIADSNYFKVGNTAVDIAGKDLLVQAGNTTVSAASGNIDGGDLLLKSGHASGTGSSSIRFWTNSGNDGVAPVEVVDIDNTGNVNIKNGSGGISGSGNSITFKDSLSNIGSVTSGVMDIRSNFINLEASSNVVIKSNGTQSLHFGYQDLRNDGVSGGEWKIVNTDANSNIHLVTTDSNGTQNNVMVADSYGRVGIGTTPNSSDYALDVYGGFKGTSNSGQNEFRVLDDHIKMEFAGSNCVFKKTNTVDTKIYNDGGGYLSLGTSGANDHMVINSSGSVGIGTTNPGTKISIYTPYSLPSTGGIVTDNPDSGISFYTSIYSYNSGGVSYQSQSPAIGSRIWYAPASYSEVGSGDAGKHGRLNFSCGHSTSTADDRIMTITSTGRVGIGTASPTSKLHINQSSANDAITIVSQNSSYTWKLYATGDNKFWIYRDGTGSNGGYVNGAVSNTQMNFTGQHRCIMNQNTSNSSVGLIVSSSNKYINIDNCINTNINESLPYCVLTNIDNDKKVFGVISDKEDIIDGGSREYSTGKFVSVYPKTNQNEQRIYINSLGEGAMWVCNKNGNLESGDYITSCTVPGYGVKQTLNEDFLTRYTVAKITCDCDFSLTKIVKQKLKVIITTDSEGKTIQNIDYDVNGDAQFEDDLDENGLQQMVYPLETRFLLADGTILADEAEYNTRLGNGEEVYIACFVGCTYHCG